jgi:hypothetical protein
MQVGIACKELPGPNIPFLSSLKVADLAEGFLNKKGSCGDIPNFETAFPVSIEASSSYISQI